MIPERKSLESRAARELRRELWSWIAALKSTHTEPPEEHQLQDILLPPGPVQER